jgi:Na+-transporting NADH:ubiquinone oxidoreductase subunit C
MNKESNLYTFTFAIIMVLVVGTILALTSEVLQPRKQQNAKDKKMIDILSAIGVDVNRSAAKEKYAKYIVDETIINNKGDVIEGSAFDIDVLFQYRDKTLSPEDFQYPFYTAEKDNQTFFIVPMAGTGLWGPVWGFVALEQDYETVYGAAFDHKAETPGLGAEINTASFEAPFKGKKIKNYLGEFVSIEVKKGGAEEGNIHQVDGITGGTITSDGVSDMLFNTLQVYNNYFSKINSVNDTTVQLMNIDNLNMQ